MPRVCSVCTHPERAEIDRALIAGSGSNRRIAAQYALNESAIRAHKANHLKVRLLKAADREAEADLRTVIDVRAQLKAINGAALTVLKEAREARDGDLALKAIDRIQKQIELQAKLIGELHDGNTINVTLSPQWIEIRAVVIGALQDHPEARTAVAAALLEVQGVSNYIAD